MCITVVNVKGLNTPAQRAGVCYVGRAFAGWKGHPLGNPFKGPGAVAHFAHWLTHHPDRVKLLTALWEECEHGAKPLGCWCLPAPWTTDRPGPHACHAQTIAVQLLALFASPAPGEAQATPQTRPA